MLMNLFVKKNLNFSSPDYPVTSSLYSITVSQQHSNTASQQHNSLKPMTIIELHKKIDQVEKDIDEENVFTQDQVEKIFSKKNKS